MTWDASSRPVKEQIRARATERQKDKKLSKVALFLPSSEAHDVKEAIAFRGGLAFNATVYAAEHGKHGSYERMVESLKGLTDFVGAVHTAQMSIEEWIQSGFINAPAPKFDYIFLDFCGPLTKNKIDSIRLLARNFTADQVRFAITLQSVWWHWADGNDIFDCHKKARKWNFQEISVPHNKTAIGQYHNQTRNEKARIQADVVYGILSEYFHITVTDTVMYRDNGGRIPMIFLQFSLQRKGTQMTCKTCNKTARGLAKSDMITRKLAGQRARLARAERKGDALTATDARRQVRILSEAQTLFK